MKTADLNSFLEFYVMRSTEIDLYGIGQFPVLKMCVWTIILDNGKGNFSPFNFSISLSGKFSFFKSFWKTANSVFEFLESHEIFQMPLLLYQYQCPTFNRMFKTIDYSKLANFPTFYIVHNNFATTMHGDPRGTLGHNT